jgi:hypothetical protein
LFRRTCDQRRLDCARVDVHRDENVLLTAYTPTETISRFTILPARPISRRGWQDRKTDGQPRRHRQADRAWVC